MKNTIILSLVLVFAFTSCQKLNLAPESSISENGFYETQAEVESALIGCYDGLQQSVQTEYMLTEMRSDNSTTVLGEGEFKLIDFFQETPDNSITTNYWQLSYNTIFRANKVMEYLDVVTDAGKRDQFEGEALFIRALNHFNLVRLFGDVPLVTEVIYAHEEEKFANSNVTAIYNQIITDLEDAADLLPAHGSIEFSRASTEAANALLARVYLTLNDYPNAMTVLNGLKGAFSLASDYPTVFEDETNDELIFSIRFKSESNGEGQIYSSEFTLTGEFGGLNNPTPELIASYDVADSARYKFSITDGGLCGKYLSTATSEDGGNDWPVIRYADVLLMYGEVENEINGPTQDALDAMNDVRLRAGLTAYTTADITSPQEYRDAMEMERVHEFAFENHRWFDLLRTGKAQSIMNAHGAIHGFSVSADQLVFAIPQREIDVSNGNLIGNSNN